MNEKLKAILAELRSHFEEIYGDRLVKMVLFGSQARGDADTGSDSIDITKEAVQTEKDLGFYEYTV